MLNFFRFLYAPRDFSTVAEATAEVQVIDDPAPGPVLAPAGGSQPAQVQPAQNQELEVVILDL